jgi:alpha-amylase
MNWDDLAGDRRTREVLEHWRKLGRFRRDHPAIGAGKHRTLQRSPYIFSRSLDGPGTADRVLVAMDHGEGEKTIPVFGVFPEGADVVDAYSGASAKVVGDSVTLMTRSGLVLLSTPSRTAAPSAR